MRDHLLESYGGAWKYNEVIGFIRLNFLGTQVRVEYWQVNKERIVRTRKKVFTFWAWKLAPETELPVRGSNAEIYEVVLSHIKDCQRALRGRYLDTTMLTTISPYIDWRALLTQSPSNLLQRTSLTGRC